MSEKDANLERIKSKIEKLFRLAEGSANEHEAASAMQKARKLMDEYQLEKIDIQGTGQHAQQFAEGRASRVFNNLPKYMSILATEVARFNDCQATLEFDRKDFKVNAKVFGNYVQFRGLKEDVEVACGMYATLLGAINRLCTEWLDSIGHTGKYPVGKGSKFKYGCASRLCGRLAGMRRIREQEYAEEAKTTGTSLVVVKGAIVESHYGVVTYGDSKFKADKLDVDEAMAYLAGQLAAETVQITGQIKNQRSQTEHE